LISKQTQIQEEKRKMNTELMEALEVLEKEKNISTQEVISMEEYLNKRQKIREQEKKRFGGRFGEEKSPAWMMAELYV
jgi:hypothetical protein